MYYVACIPINNMEALNFFAVMYAELSEGDYWTVIQEGVKDGRLHRAPGRYLCLDYGLNAELKWSSSVSSPPAGVIYTVDDAGTVTLGHNMPRLVTWPPKAPK